MPVFELHGITVDSPIPLGLCPVDESRVLVPDYYLRIGGLPNAHPVTPNGRVIAQKRLSNGVPNVTIYHLHDEAYLLRIHFWMDFVVAGASIECHILRSASSDEIARIFTSLVIGWLLRCRGNLVLHCSAVCSRSESRLICLVGRSGSGKSTLAAMLAQQRYSLVTDDILSLGPDLSAAVPPRRLLLTQRSLKLVGIRRTGSEAMPGKIDAGSLVSWHTGEVRVTDIVSITRTPIRKPYVESLSGDACKDVILSNLFLDFVPPIAREVALVDALAERARVHKLVCPPGDVDPRGPISAMVAELGV